MSVGCQILHFVSKHHVGYDVCSNIQLFCVNPFRMKTQKYLFPRGNKPSYCIIKLATEISLFSLQISKT